MKFCDINIGEQFVKLSDNHFYMRIEEVNGFNAVAMGLGILTFIDSNENVRVDRYRPWPVEFAVTLVDGSHERGKMIVESLTQATANLEDYFLHELISIDQLEWCDTNRCYFD